MKWAVPIAEREEDSEKALRVLAGIRSGSLEAVQPPHWLAEVAAVTARLLPDESEPMIVFFHALDLPIAGEIDVYRRAGRLAAALGHHLFDTLYHAVALERGATLVTADDRYERKARLLGGIARLADF